MAAAYKQHPSTTKRDEAAEEKPLPAGSVSENWIASHLKMMGFVT
jgi:hypothetical protein